MDANFQYGVREHVHVNELGVWPARLENNMGGADLCTSLSKYINGILAIEM